MEGLKLIAQSTFDRHQKFRPAAAQEGGAGGPYRYNVVEIGAFGGGGGAAGAKRRVALNEWMVFEEDLNAFMKKRPVDLAQQAAAAAAAAAAGGGSNSSNKGAGGGSSGSTDQAQEAVASLKLVCIQRVEPEDSTDDDEGPTPGQQQQQQANRNNNTLAISRDTFLRLYVNQMDADHCALYYLAREYDGFHEFSDSAKGIATKFVGTSDYALIWTFNRRTLETKGLFIDRCGRWRAKDSSPAAAAAAPPSNNNNNNNNNNSRPTTPVRKQVAGEAGGGNSLPCTPSKRWTRNRTGSVSASEAWQGFRETLNVYRGYVFAAQLPGFVGCVHMLRSFDDQVSDDDLPLLNSIEASLADEDEDEDEEAPVAAVGGRLTNGGGMMPGAPIQHTNSFAVVTDPANPFGPSTPPAESEKPTAQQHQQAARPPRTRGRERLASQAVSVDTSLANKQRHLKTATKVLEAVSRDHETAIVDVVAPAFLDRYHWTMEGMSEAIPALERHTASLDEYLRYLKGRAERLSGLISDAARRSPAPPGAASSSLEASAAAAGWLRVTQRPLVSTITTTTTTRTTTTAGGLVGGGQKPGEEGPRGSLSLNSDVASLTVASMPAIFSAGIIAIVSSRSSLAVPCVVVVFYGWLIVAHKGWLVELRGQQLEVDAKEEAQSGGIVNTGLGSEEEKKCIRRQSNEDGNFFNEMRRPLGDV